MNNSDFYAELDRKLSFDELTLTDQQCQALLTYISRRAEALVGELQRRNPTCTISRSEENRPLLLELTAAQLWCSINAYPEQVTPTEAAENPTWKSMNQDEQQYWETVLKIIHRLTKQAPLSLSEYQDFCPKTECSYDNPEDLKRWKASWSSALVALSFVKNALATSRADAIKKYAAYGKIPDDLILTISKADAVGVTAWNIANFAPVAEGETGPYRLLHHILGKTSELEELLDSFLNSCLRVFYDEAAGIGWQPPRDAVHMKDFDTVNLLEELGDDAWYTAGMANTLELSYQKIIEANKAKLLERYKAKKAFSSEDAINRDITLEQEILAAASTTTTQTAVEPSLVQGNTLSTPTTPAPVQTYFCSDCQTALMLGNPVIAGGKAVEYCPKCDPEIAAENAQSVPADIEVVAIPPAPVQVIPSWPIGSVGYMSGPKRLRQTVVTIVSPPVPYVNPEMMRRVRYTDPADGSVQEQDVHVNNLLDQPFTTGFAR